MKILPFEYAVRNLGRSSTRLMLSIVGSALVVLLLLTAAAFVRGMERALKSTGEPDNVIIVGAGSEESIERSEVDSGVAGLVAASIAGIRSRAQVPYLSVEVQVQMATRTQPEQRDAPLVVVRGITPAAFLVHSYIQISEGRLPTNAADEIIVGAMVSTKIGLPDSELAIGKSLIFDKRPFRIVGRFVAPGTVIDSEVWMPLYDLKQLTKRTTDSSIIITLDPAIADFADVATFVKTRPDLELAAIRETVYYGKLARFFAPIRIMAWITASLIGLGGLFGGLNTMFAAFASRVRELGTLQAMGFRRLAIVLSLVQESVLATMVGSLLAGCLAVAVLDGVAVRFSRGTFGLVVDASVIAVGLMAGVLLGLVGSLPPAWRCLRLEIPMALKAV